jgi:hypothetical protein
MITKEIITAQIIRLIRPKKLRDHDPDQQSLKLGFRQINRKAAPERPEEQTFPEPPLPSVKGALISRALLCAENRSIYSEPTGG